MCSLKKSIHLSKFLIKSVGLLSKAYFLTRCLLFNLMKWWWCKLRCLFKISPFQGHYIPFIYFNTRLNKHSDVNYVVFFINICHHPLTKGVTNRSVTGYRYRHLVSELFCGILYPGTCEVINLLLMAAVCINMISGLLTVQKICRKYPSKQHLSKKNYSWSL